MSWSFIWLFRLWKVASLKGRVPVAGLLVSVVGIAGCAKAGAQDHSGPRAIPDELPAETASFDDETYYLRFEGEAVFNSLREYLPEGETLEDWTSLIAEWEYPHRHSIDGIPLEYSRQLRHKDNEFQCDHVDDDILMSFVMWEGRTRDTAAFVEFNVMRFMLREGGGGSRMWQVARRAYHDDIPEFLENLPELRERLVGELAEGLPVVTGRPATGAAKHRTGK